MKTQRAEEPDFVGNEAESEETDFVRNESESEETPVHVVVLAAILISIPLGFCCYYLLQLR